MNAVRCALLALTLALVAAVSPVHAAGAASPSSASGVNPSQACADNTVIVQFAPGPDGSFPLPIPSHGGCVSTVAGHGTVTESGQVVVAPGDYSHSAFVTQCKLLQSMLPAALWNAPVTIVQTDQGPMNVGGFGGKIETCAWLLQAYHSGTLSHPE